MPARRDLLLVLILRDELHLRVQLKRQVRIDVQGGAEEVASLTVVKSLSNLFEQGVDRVLGVILAVIEFLFLLQGFDPISIKKLQLSHLTACCCGSLFALLVLDGVEVLMVIIFDNQEFLGTVVSANQVAHYLIGVRVHMINPKAINLRSCAKQLSGLQPLGVRILVLLQIFLELI